MKFTTTNNDVLMVKTSGKCAGCGEETNFVDFLFEAYICSTECLDKINKKFDDAVSRSRTILPGDRVVVFNSGDLSFDFGVIVNAINDDGTVEVQSCGTGMKYTVWGGYIR